MVLPKYWTGEADVRENGSLSACEFAAIIQCSLWVIEGSKLNGPARSLMYATSTPGWLREASCPD